MRRPLGNRPVSRPTSVYVTRGVGLLAVTLICLMAYVGYNSPNSIPGRSYYNLRAQFEFADNLTSHYQVRAGGRLIGQVLRPRVEGGKAVVDLQLDPGIGPLLSDTTISVRPRSPVGVRFLDVTPGTRGRPLAEGDMIPATQTGATTSLDTILGTLDARTRDRTRTLLHELGTGFAGRGRDLGPAIAGGPGLLDDLTTLARSIRSRPGATRDLVDGLERATAAVSPVRGRLAASFGPSAAALRIVTDARSDVRATLGEAPPTLESVRSTLPATGALVREIGGLSEDLRPLLRLAPVALEQGASLLHEGQAPVRRLETTLREIDGAVDPTVALLQRAKVELPDVDVTLTTPQELLTELGPRGCDARSFFGNWADMDSYGTESTNRLRFEVVGPDVESVQGQKAPLAGLPTADFLQNPYPAPCTAGNEHGDAHTNHPGGVPEGDRGQDPETITAGGGKP
jgi:ABC-type transporter Mla subunit MlaD